MSLGPALRAALEATTSEVLHAQTHDAVVIGSGAAGGMAALLLAEAGLRVLVLEAGTAPPALQSPPPYSTQQADAARQPIQSYCYAWHLAPQMYVDDLDCPYVTPPHQPYVWVRSRQLGGRIVVPGHGWQYYRLGPDDFAPRDGLSPRWPFPPGELDAWYSAVERRLGMAGMRDSLPWLPDSDLQRVLEPMPHEASLRAAVQARWPHARPVMARFAAPFDALEAAAGTGRLLARGGAIVKEIEVDAQGQVSGVVWVDRDRRTEHRTKAGLVFLCASTLESTRLLLLSRSGRHPDGLGAASGVLGRYLMDHVWLKAQGYVPRGLPSGTPIETGRCLYLPRFDARDMSSPGPGRGYGVQLYHLPLSERRAYFVASAFAEMPPRPENHVTLDQQQRDAWDIPVLRIDYRLGETPHAADQHAVLQRLGGLLDVEFTSLDDAPRPPGSAMHECGTARMGSDPDNSVLDPFNQCWAARGLYVTDGACFPSQGSQNPTLTIMALTARACDQALRDRRRSA